MYLDTMRYRRIRGLVVQNRYLRGELGGPAAVDFIESRPEPKRATIEPVMATPENLDKPGLQKLWHLPTATPE